ncbi:MAG: hypothetical protein IJD52_02295 [Alphaproteobacteria bacterium]|nr:hypothetical protein [Alphaproteobacteria bacterium]
MKKLLYPLFALFLALPTQSFGAFSGDLIIDPTLCGNKSCLNGYLDPRTCECITIETICDGKTCPNGYTLNLETCECDLDEDQLACMYWPALTCPATYTKDTLTCSNLLCNSCRGTTTRNNSLYGHTETVQQTIQYTCNDTTSSYTCSCKTTVMARECMEGFYGTASTTSTTGCTACPSNATCAGGNGSTFVCNSGYIPNATGTACVSCPSNGTCLNNNLNCDVGYYKQLNICMRCPQHNDNNKTYGTTGDGIRIGFATDITECYLQSGDSLSDAKGTYELTDDCYYQN